MARRNKQKKADETIIDLVQARDSAQSFFDKNQMLVLGVIIGLAVIVGGFFAYKLLYLAPKNDRAVEEMYRAQIQFERDSFALALENPGGGYGGFLDIIDNYGGTKAANLSKYYAGISYLNLGQYEAAIDFLQDYKAGGEVTPIMKSGAIGDAYSELQNFDKAISQYRKAASMKDNDLLSAYYLKKLGMLLEKQGDYKGSFDAYSKIKTEYPTSSEGTDIDKYIARVEGK